MMSDAPAADLQLPLHEGVEVLTRAPGGLVAFDKPAGVLSHPNMRSEQPRALLTCDYSIEGEFFRWTDAAGAARTMWLLNRLDSHTSGVILGVLDNTELARRIRALFREKHIRKVYHALVFGKPSQPSAVWRDKLAIEKRGGQVRTKAGEGIPSECEVKVLRQRRDPALALTLIELTPRTGRSHQLRVQCAHRRLPIVGDATYGDFGANRALAKATGVKRLCLHSHETRFDYEHEGRAVKFAAVAPTPAEFLKLL
jgi:23S rRNA-/tRNA-specific pseudouridylate synthase